jgi:ribonuclease E
LARREAVDRVMVIRQRDELTQIGVLEDDVLVEHYVAQQSATTMVGTVYLGKVQNVLPSMEAAFVDVGRGRNAVLYAGEVNWDAAGLDGQPRRIEHALKSGDSVLVQVTKDPIGHKGARLTAQVSLPGRYLVYVPDGSMTGISRKLPDTERSRLKAILKRIVPDDAGVIVRTAAEGASEDELSRDVARLSAQWESIEEKAKTASAPELLYEEPDLTIRVVRDIFNEDFKKVVVSGGTAAETVEEYVAQVAPDLADRVSRWTADEDVFSAHRIDEQVSKALDRKVWLPSGGYLIIDPTEAMTVVDVNTGKFTGSGGNLEETVTKNNLEAAEEIVRQLRLRDVGGIIVVDFIDMVLESNRELVLRRLVECLGRDRTKHQVAEVTSLGLVQMTRKRVGQGLLEAFSTTCEHCNGRGRDVHLEPVEAKGSGSGKKDGRSSRRRRGAATAHVPEPKDPETEAKEAAAKAALINVAEATLHAHETEASAASDEDLEERSAGLLPQLLPGPSADVPAEHSAEHSTEHSTEHRDEEPVTEPSV